MKRIGSSNSVKASKCCKCNIMTLYKKPTEHFIDYSKIGMPSVKRMQPSSMTCEAQWFSRNPVKLIVRQSKEGFTGQPFLWWFSHVTQITFKGTEPHAHLVGAHSSSSWHCWRWLQCEHAFMSAHRFFIPPKLSCLTSNIPCPPTSKLDDSPMKVSLWNVHDGLRMTPNPHLTCLYLFSSINSYTMVNLLGVLGSSLSQGCED